MDATVLASWMAADKRLSSAQSQLEETPQITDMDPVADVPVDVDEGTGTVSGMGEDESMHCGPQAR